MLVWLHQQPRATRPPPQPPPPGAGKSGRLCCPLPPNARRLLGLGEVVGDVLPVHDLPDLLHVVRAHVLVLQVVRSARALLGRRAREPSSSSQSSRRPGAALDAARAQQQAGREDGASPEFVPEGSTRAPTRRCQARGSRPEWTPGPAVVWAAALRTVRGLEPCCNHVWRRGGGGPHLVGGGADDELVRRLVVAQPLSRGERGLDHYTMDLRRAPTGDTPSG